MAVTVQSFLASIAVVIFGGQPRRAASTEISKMAQHRILSNTEGSKRRVRSMLSQAFSSTECYASCMDGFEDYYELQLCNELSPEVERLSNCIHTCTLSDPNYAQYVLILFVAVIALCVFLVIGSFLCLRCNCSSSERTKPILHKAIKAAVLV